MLENIVVENMHEETIESIAGAQVLYTTTTDVRYESGVE